MKKSQSERTDARYKPRHPRLQLRNNRAERDRLLDHIFLQEENELRRR